LKVKAKVKVLPHQKAYAENRDSFVGIVAGYGSGKSDADVFRTFSLARYRNRMGQKFSLVLTAPTYRILKDANIPDFMEFLEKYKVRNIYRDNDKKVILQADELKGEIWFRSADKPENIVGFDATDAILDEYDIQKPAKQKEVWTKINGRMRGCTNSTLAISTTAEGFRYTYQLFHEENIGTLINARTYHNVYLPIGYVWNNLFKQYGKNVPKEIPEELLETYNSFWNESDQDKRDALLSKLFKIWDNYYLLYYTPLLGQYVGGEFVNINGLAALYAFDRSKNIIEPINRRNTPRDLIIGMDFNVSPFTATISYLEYDYQRKPAKMVTFDERYIVNNGINTEYSSYTDKAIQSILNEYPNAFWKRTNPNNQELQSKPTYNITICPDMSGMKGLGKRQTSASRTDIQILKQYEVNINGVSNPKVRDRLNSANTALYNNKWEITSNCEYLIRDCEKVVIDKYGDIDKSDIELAQIIDAGTYAVFRYFPIKKENRNIIRSA